MARRKGIARGEPGTTGDGTAADFLFKPDRPREIDRYIDYFGRAGDAPAVADRVIRWSATALPPAATKGDAA